MAICCPDLPGVRAYRWSLGRPPYGSSGFVGSQIAILEVTTLRRGAVCPGQLDQTVRR